MSKDDFEKEIIKSIIAQDDNKINILCNRMLQEGIELEDLDLKPIEVDYVIKVCLETGFPNI